MQSRRVSTLTRAPVDPGHHHTLPPSPFPSFQYRLTGNMTPTGHTAPRSLPGPRLRRLRTTYAHKDCSISLKSVLTASQGSDPRNFPNVPATRPWLPRRCGTAVPMMESCGRSLLASEHIVDVFNVHMMNAMLDLPPEPPERTPV